MKRYLIWLCLIFIASGCSNEINLYSSKDPTPIVYCLLNPNTDVQYVRLAKTYMSEKSAEGWAPGADSTTWDVPLNVYLEKYGENDDPVEVIYFEKTDNPDKEAGLFPENSFHLYKADFRPEAGKGYVLYVHFRNPSGMLSAQTIVMDAPEIVDPLNVPYREITFDSLAAMYIRWIPADNGGLYQGVYRFHFAEGKNDFRENKSIDFPTPITAGLDQTEVLEQKINSNNFFKYLAENLEEVPGMTRIPIGIEYIFYSTGYDLGLWYHTLSDQTSSPTNVFEYTNIEGGYGIFSSWVVQRVPNIPLSPVSVRNLQTHKLTKNLGFKED